MLPNTDPELARAPAAAEVDAVLNSGHLAAYRPFLWMRRSKSFSLVPSARQTTARSAKPAIHPNSGRRHELAVIDTGHHRHGHHHRSMRTSPSSP